MIKYRAILFLLLASMFAATHLLAVELDLYWYIDGFDIFMHIWGGFLITYCLYVIKDLNLISYNLTLGLVTTVILFTVVGWEIFEWSVGLYDSSSYIRESAKDITVGLVSGLTAYIVINRYNE